MGVFQILWGYFKSTLRSRQSNALSSPDSELSPLISKSLPLTKTPQPHTLAGMPTELILKIADFLPPDDLKCFFSCNHRLHAVLHHQVRRLPRVRNPEDKLPILLRLERDLPKCYFLCRVCFVFHKYDGSDNYGLEGLGLDRRHACVLLCLQRCQIKSRLTMKVYESTSFHDYTIYFFQLQLAMRRYHYGPEAGISTDSLFYTEVRRHGEWSARPNLHPGALQLFSADAQICPEPLGLYVRMQDIFCVRADRQDLLAPFPIPDTISDPPGVYLPCQHMPKAAFHYMLGDLVDIYRREQKASTPAEIYTCKKCTTEAQFQICEIDTNIALVVTRWIYLGNGASLDDNYWRMQSVDAVYSSRNLRPSEMIASARACFENATPRSLDALQTCNISYLQNQRFKKLMYKGRYSDRWCLPWPKR